MAHRSNQFVVCGKIVSRAQWLRPQYRRGMSLPRLIREIEWLRVTAADPRTSEHDRVRACVYIGVARAEMLRRARLRKDGP